MRLHLFTSCLKEALLSYLEIVQTGVRGIVTDEKGEPLVKANIEISGIYYTEKNILETTRTRKILVRCTLYSTIEGKINGTLIIGLEISSITVIIFFVQN